MVYSTEFHKSLRRGLRELLKDTLWFWKTSHNLVALATDIPSKPLRPSRLHNSLIQAPIGAINHSIVIHSLYKSQSIPYPSQPKLLLGDMPLPSIGTFRGFLCPTLFKSMPSLVPHKPQFTPPNEVILSILKLDYYKGML
jgi:hypothetical protein